MLRLRARQGKGCEGYQVTHFNEQSVNGAKTGEHARVLEMSVDQARSRHNARHAMILDSFRHLIADSTVLCLGAGDGQWCRDIAMAGALQVVGVENSISLVNAFQQSAGLGADERVEMLAEQPVKALQVMAEQGRQFDVIVAFDLFQESADLTGIFSDLADLQPRIVFADGLIARMEEPALRLQSLRNDSDGYAHLRLVPSRSAIGMVADAVGFDVDWTDWNVLPEAARTGLADYFRHGPVARSSFTMLPSVS